MSRQGISKLLPCSSSSSSSSSNRPAALPPVPASHEFSLAHRHPNRQLASRSFCLHAYFGKGENPPFRTRWGLACGILCNLHHTDADRKLSSCSCCWITHRANHFSTLCVALFATGTRWIWCHVHCCSSRHSLHHLKLEQSHAWRTWHPAHSTRTISARSEEHT